MKTSLKAAAIEREKQIKGWTRSKKITLITDFNPKWEDLAANWYNRFKPDGAVQVEPPSTAREILRR